ncbi:MAG TPA: dihydrofolate reductase family protein [Devosia sp.]|jgi:dihydrofolate reductase|nr:dihydrofolate reductase family protein [Devosia sp.]
MRNVVLAMFMSLDGYTEAPNGEMVPPPFSADLKTKWIDRNLSRADLLMYGRVAYEGMVAFWTAPNAPAAEAAQLAAFDKLVFSRTLQKADWGNVSIVADNIADEVQRRRAQPGKDMVLLAGAGIANSFLELDLIDEMDLMIMPVLFGGGKRLFSGNTGRRKLQLAESFTMTGGLVRAIYRR